MMENVKAPLPVDGALRAQMVGRTIKAIRFETDDEGAPWCSLILDNLREVKIFDAVPWVHVDPEQH